MSETTLLAFPCLFPIKAMGRVDVQLELVVTEIVYRHSPETDTQTLTSRPSKDGNYLAVTITVTATSKPQLDAIYQDLTDHPLVLVAL